MSPIESMMYDALASEEPTNVSVWEILFESFEYDVDRGPLWTHRNRLQRRDISKARSLLHREAAIRQRDQIADDNDSWSRRTVDPCAPFVFLFREAPIASYRVDFLLWIDGDDMSGGIAIECDGHDYHERTKLQAEHDRSRDRTLLGLGIPTARFTGSEIFRFASRCAKQSYDLLIKTASR